MSETSFYTFILADSFITPDSFLLLFQTSHFFISFPQSPLLWTIDSKESKCSTFFMSPPCTFTSPWVPLIYTCSVLLQLPFTPLLSMHTSTSLDLSWCGPSSTLTSTLTPPGHLTTVLQLLSGSFIFLSQRQLSVLLYFIIFCLYVNM